MKKKLIKILMLLVVAVSMGAFVSCKDTNEDLYNELRNELGLDAPNADKTVTQRLAELEANLQAIKQCSCGEPGGLKDQVTNLTNIINALTGGGASGGGTTGGIDIGGGVINVGGGGGSDQGSGMTLNQIFGDEIINLIKNQGDLATLINMILNELYTTDGDGNKVSNIQDLLARMKAAEGQIADTREDVDSLLADVEELKKNQCKCGDLLQRVVDLETGYKEVKDRADAAYSLADSALNAVKDVETLAKNAEKLAYDAQEAANNAQKAADAAQDSANVALNEARNAADAAQKAADKIKEVADALTSLSDQVKRDSAAIADNKKLIDAMDGRITILSDSVRTVFTIASEAAAQAEANARYIDTLKNDVQANKDAIAKLDSVNGVIIENVNTLQGDVNTLKDNYKALQDSITAHSGLINNMQNALDKLNQTVSSNTTRIDSLEANYTKLIENLENLDTRLKAVEAVCENLLKDAKAYTDLEVANLKKALEEKITANSEKIDSLQKVIDQIKSCTCDTAATKKAIQDILDRLKADEDSIAGNKAAIDQLNQDLTKLINDKIADLQEQIDSLNYVTPEQLATELGNLETKLTNLIQAEKDARESGDEKLQKQIDSIAGLVAGALTDIVDMKAALAALDTTYVKIKDFDAYKDQNEKDKQEIWDSIYAHTTKIDANTTKIGELQDSINSINSKLDGFEERLTSLETDMKAAKKLLNEVYQDVLKLKDDVAHIQDYLAAQVTSIDIEGTYNPWFGTFALPVDVQSNVLIALYGTPKTMGEFPTSKTGNYVKRSGHLSEKDMQMLKLTGLEVMDIIPNIPLMFEPNKDKEGSGYAGKIYMTINPNTNDVSGLQPAIVNSLDEESEITLEPIQKSEARLQFGFTRADNGFYEAEAYVPSNKVSSLNGPKFETGALADAMANARDALEELAKNQSTSGTGSKLERVASDVATIMRGLRFDRSALKITYPTTDPKTGDAIQQSVYSRYNLAATAFRPLNLKTAEDFNYQTIPGYEKANALLDRVSNKVHEKVGVFFKDFTGSALVDSIKNLTITDIEVADLTPEQLALFKVSIDTTLWIKGLEYHLDLSQTVNVPVKFTTDVTVPVNIDEDVTIDMSKVTVNTPTVVITTDIKNKNGTAFLVVPVKDTHNDEIGYANVDLTQVQVKADATLGEITLDGTVVAHLTYNDNVTASITVDETVQTTVNIEKWIYFGDYELDDDGNIVEGGTHTNAKQFHLWVTRDLSDAAESLWGTAQDALSDVNSMLNQLRGIVKEVNYLIDKINSYESQIYDTVDSALDKVRKYLDKFNTAIVNLVNSTNERFQPFLILEEKGKGMKRPGTRGYPAKVTSTDITLYPTSQTMELLVPMARKHVGVTNVFKGSASAQGGDEACKQALKKANKGKVNKVLDGTVHQVKMDGLTKGYVYEIAFSALDFQGQISTRKYYIEVQ